MNYVEQLKKELRIAELVNKYRGNKITSGETNGRNKRISNINKPKRR